MLNALNRPDSDPTPIFELFRGAHATELLTAAVAHFDIFGKLNASPQTFDSLRKELGLEERPAVVLFTALKAMKLIEQVEDVMQLTPIASEHLVPGNYFDCGNYVGLAAQSPGVLAMVEMLKTNQPMQVGDDGVAFIFRDGIRSAMDASQHAEHFTRALAGRAKNVAASFAAAAETENAKTLLDVGGGTGIYSYALLQKQPELRATIFDHPQVLKIAEQTAKEYGVGERCSFVAGDMFKDKLPQSDVILLSNILHDWDVPQCEEIVKSCAAALPSGGRLLIHDVFLDDSLDGPLPIALYSASLFSFTEGRAYSGAEYRKMLTESGLVPQPIIPTLVHCGVLCGFKN